VLHPTTGARPGGAPGGCTRRSARWLILGLGCILALAYGCYVPVTVGKSPIACRQCSGWLPGSGADQAVADRDGLVVISLGGAVRSLLVQVPADRLPPDLPL